MHGGAPPRPRDSCRSDFRVGRRDSCAAFSARVGFASAEVSELEAVLIAARLKRLQAARKPGLSVTARAAPRERREDGSGLPRPAPPPGAAGPAGPVGFAVARVGNRRSRRCSQAARLANGVGRAQAARQRCTRLRCQGDESLASILTRGRARCRRCAPRGERDSAARPRRLRHSILERFPC